MIYPFELYRDYAYTGQGVNPGDNPQINALLGWWMVQPDVTPGDLVDTLWDLYTPRTLVALTDDQAAAQAEQTNQNIFALLERVANGGDLTEIQRNSVYAEMNLISHPENDTQAAVVVRAGTKNNNWLWIALAGLGAYLYLNR